jgi:hypothetical protein
MSSSSKTRAALVAIGALLLAAVLVGAVAGLGGETGSAQRGLPYSAPASTAPNGSTHVNAPVASGSAIRATKPARAPAEGHAAPTPAESPAPTGAETHPTPGQAEGPAAPAAKRAPAGTPQANGGDSDPDNNGGPDDGDGSI